MAGHIRFGLLIALIGLAGCRTEPAAENAVAPAPAGNSAGPVRLPQPEESLDRSALLLAVVQARSAAGAGTDDLAAQRELDGKRFEFRIRLGCALAPPDQAGARATFDAAERRVEISAPPDLTLRDPAVAAIAGAGFEAAEGFRVAAPWLLVPHCAGRQPPPAAAAPATPAAPAATGKAGVSAAKAPADDTTGEAPSPPGEPGATAAAPRPGLVGLVQFFTAEDPRGGRRDGRAYAARETLPEGSAPPEPGSWELVLTGRLQALPGGRVIACAPAGPGEPPACIVSVRFDRVAIVNRVSGAQLAEWSEG